MKIILFISLFFSVSLECKSQMPASINGFESVEDYFNKQYFDPMRRRIYPYTIDTLCESGCSFLSFRINKKGEISNIHFDTNTPKVVEDLFRRICQESNNKWVIDKSIKQDEISILIPLYYNFYRTEGVCTTKKNNCENGLFAMMSTFQNSVLNRRTNVERTKEPQNVWLYSPMYFKTVVYLSSSSK